MGSPYVGEIRMFAGNFPPVGWMFCDGQSLPISENDTLFNLIGTTYGGDGQETFNLPDLQGRLPIHMGTGPGLQNYVIGEKSGVESVTLTTQQIPSHTHTPLPTAAQGNAGTATAGAVLASMGPAGISQVPCYTPFVNTNQITLNASTIAPAGGSQPHENLQPYLCVNFIISLFGIFPSPT
jgi:microcystin-dependent protein